MPSASASRVGRRRLLVVLADDARASARAISPRRVAHVVRRQALDRRPQPVGRDAGHRRRGGGHASAVDAGRHDRAQHRLGHRRRRRAGVERGEAGAPPGVGLRAVEAEGGARVEQGQRAHAPGWSQRRVQRDHAAQREADEVRLRRRRACRAARPRRRPGRGSERAGRRRRGAVARQVPRHAAEATASAASCGSKPVRVMPSPCRNTTSGPAPASRQATGAASTSRGSTAVSSSSNRPKRPEAVEADLGAPRQHQRAAARVAVVLLQRQVLEHRARRRRRGCRATPPPAPSPSPCSARPTRGAAHRASGRRRPRPRRPPRARGCARAVIWICAQPDCFCGTSRRAAMPGGAAPPR